MKNSDSVNTFENGDVDGSNLRWAPNHPIELCGVLNEDGNIYFRDMICYDNVPCVCIDDDGILHAPKEITSLI